MVDTNPNKKSYKKKKRARPNKKVKQYVFKDKLQVFVDTQEYKDFIKLLQDNADNPDYNVCLTCWRFVNPVQCKLHLFYGHHCLPHGRIRTSDTFQHYCKTFLYYVQKKVVAVIRPIEPNTKDVINCLCHDVKFGICFTGSFKGQPPYLNEPTIPFNTVKQELNPRAIMEEIEEEQARIRLYKECLRGKGTGVMYKVKFGEYVKGYTRENQMLLV